MNSWAIALSLPVFASLFLVAFNALTLVTVRARKARAITGKVAILVPMRNEALNIQPLLASLTDSELLPERAIYILNDQSTDATGELLAPYASTGVATIIEGAGPAEGWLGKPAACFALGNRALEDGAEYLVFIDADTRVTPRAIAAAITEMNSRSWDFISPHPRERARSPIARFIQPLMQWSWCASVPVRLGIALKVPSMAIANGQFIIIKASCYKSSGGHSIVKSEILEDLQLARALVAQKFSGGVAIAADVAECLMYESDQALRAGYSKSLWRAFGSPVGATIAATLLLATQTLPFILALTGSVLAWKIYLLTALTHLIVAIKVRSNPVNTFAHPLAILIFVLMIIDSFRKKAAGTLAWKDRFIG